MLKSIKLPIITTLLTLLFTALLGVFTFTMAAEKAKSENIIVDNHPIHYGEWGAKQKNKPVLLLLTGPTDTWHSDSAWWASFAPKVADKWQVIALDRAGLFNGLDNAPVGYQHFATDLHQFIENKKLKNITFITFASASISLNLYLKNHSSNVKKVIMIDPDVLTPYSIARYKKDAKPFIDNQKKYAEYLGAGKYVARVEQKNTWELKLIGELVENDTSMDWDYLNLMFSKRLEIPNQLNLFREITVYGNDLDAVAGTKFPSNIPLTVIDTQFEQHYIDDSDDEEVNAELRTWQADAKAYYQQLVSNVMHGKYVEVDSKEHLYQFVDPENLIKLLNQDK